MANLSQGVQRFGVNLQSAPYPLTSSAFDIGTGTTIYYLDSSGNLKSWVKGRSSFLNTLPGTNKDQLPAYAAFQVNPGGAITTDDTKFSFETAISSSAGTVYYVSSSSGSDSNNGTTKITPWQTIAKVNSSVFLPGDSILFKGGDFFSTTTGIIFNVSNASNGTGGTITAPIVIGSYDGMATIKSTQNGVYLNNVEYINVRSLNLIGSSIGVYADYDGIRVQNNLQTPKTLSGIKITNCNIDSFPASGIKFLTIAGAIGYNNCEVLGCAVTACIIWGILSIIDPGASSFSSVMNQRVFTNFSIFNCLVHDCPGDATTNVSVYPNISGNGISIGNCTNGVIDHCTSYSNGGTGAGGTGGSGGIWCFASDNVTIQYCEAYGQKMNPVNHYDGCGFDIDYNCVNCVLQYCYSHDNEGAGIETVLSSTGNIIRFNIFANNASGNDAEIAVKDTDVGTKVYNNTVYAATTAFATKGSTTGYLVSNNLFVVKAGGVLVNKVNSSDSSSFSKNLYWEAAGNFKSTTAGTSITSFATWGLDSTGIFANPQWLAPNSPMSFGKNGSNFNSKLSAYNVYSSSPAKDVGLNISGGMGSYDFEGRSLTSPYANSLGAFSQAFTTPLVSTATELKTLLTWTSILDDNFTRSNGAPGNNYVESPSGVYVISNNKLQTAQNQNVATTYLLRPTSENNNYQKSIIETTIQGANVYLNLLHHYNSGYALMATIYFDSTKIYGAIDKLLNRINNNYIAGSGAGAVFTASHVYRIVFYTGTAGTTVYCGWEIYDVASPSTVLASFFGSDTTASILTSGNFGITGTNAWAGISRYATYKA